MDSITPGQSFIQSTINATFCTLVLAIFQPSHVMVMTDP